MLAELSNRELIEKIEMTRESMVLNGLQYGLSHPDTIKLSQILDDLLNDLSLLEHRE